MTVMKAAHLQKAAQTGSGPSIGRKSGSAVPWGRPCVVMSRSEMFLWRFNVLLQVLGQTESLGPGSDQSARGFGSELPDRSL